MPSPTVPQGLPELLSYFRTGDTPSQDEFEELIRTLYEAAKDAKDASDAAVAALNAQTTAVADYTPKVYGTASMDITHAVTVAKQKGCAITADASGSTNKIKVTFTTPFANANYTLLATFSNSGTGTKAVLEEFDRTTTFCRFKMTDGGALNAVRLDFVILNPA